MTDVANDGCCVRTPAEPVLLHPICSLSTCCLLRHDDHGHDATQNYIHRIGRTARGNASGDAYTFFTSADAKFANKLVGVLRGANQDVPAELQKMDRGGGRGGGRGGWRGGRGGRGGGGRGRGGFGGRGRKW